MGTRTATDLQKQEKISKSQLNETKESPIKASWNKHNALPQNPAMTEIMEQKLDFLNQPHKF